jgi:hypothetical protein
MVWLGELGKELLDQFLFVDGFDWLSLGLDWHNWG